MEQKAGAQTSTRAFIQSLVILFVLMIAAGVLPRIIPAGSYTLVAQGDRQVTVTAYCFGDGFSNLAYPTNPVLLISLGLTVVSYPRWIRWSWKLWVGVLLVTVLFLALGVAIGYGPF